MPDYLWFVFGKTEGKAKLENRFIFFQRNEVLFPT